MSPVPSLLRIGPFARLARVTIKTLRFYDRAGIFRPAVVDPASGYRYYCATQVPRLRHIRLLRELGCSIAEITLLAAPGIGGDRDFVAGLRRRLLVSAASAEQRLKLLDSLIGGVAAAQALPLVNRRLEAIPAFTMRDCVRLDGGDIHRMFESAERRVARLGARSNRSPFLLMHDMQYGNDCRDVEVCIPISSSALGSSGTRSVESVSRAACVRFTGGYEQAPALLEATLDSLTGTPTRIAGPIREVYMRFGADQRGYRLDPRFLADHPSRFRTELQVPVTGAPGRQPQGSVCVKS